MPRIAIPFVGQAYKAHSMKINAQRCVNFYLEPGGPDSSTQAALIGTPGLTRILTVPNAPAAIRWLQRHKDVLVVTAGDKVYSYDKNWEVTESGTILSTFGPGLCEILS